MKCLGSEVSFKDCTFEEPTTLCDDHANDVAIRCTNNPPNRDILPGTIRLVDASGAPTKDGIGRLEYYMYGFGTVCQDNWTKQSEHVACLEMGYTGLLNGGISDQTCSDFKGVNYCGDDKQRISVVNMACVGQESNLRDCPHQTEDPDCVHEEDVIIACSGIGDPSGVGLFRAEDPPIFARRHFLRLNLNCGSRILTEFEMQGPPGSMFIVNCPDGCSEESGILKGTFIYTGDSPICKAAIHSGVIDMNGGEVVVVLGHQQNSFFASQRHEISSESCGPYPKSFLVSKPISSVLSAASTADESPNSKFAGKSTIRDKGMIATSFIQIEEKSKWNNFEALSDSFNWFPNTEWQGFRGSDYVIFKFKENEGLTSEIEDFTIIVRAKESGGKGTWRSIFAQGDCEGFELAISDKDELVLEQSCHSNYINTGFSPKSGEWFDVELTYFKPEKAISIFVNGKKVAEQKNDFDIEMKSYLVIGKASIVDSEYFLGEISSLRIFSYVLPPDQIQQAIQDDITPNARGMTQTKVMRRTEDGRLCLSSCTSEESLPFLNHEGYPKNPSIELSCLDTIESSNFNGIIGKKFRVRCPSDCFRMAGIIKGNKVYTEDTAVCKAALHAGVLQKKGGEIVVTIHSGLDEYEGVNGFYGITSQYERDMKIRSFCVSKAPDLLKLNCSDDATFIMKMGVGEQQLVVCPPGCDKFPNIRVFGSEFYSPLSSVCLAAIHSGHLGTNGGQVEIEVGSEHQSFNGTSRYGIESLDSGHYLRSFGCIDGDNKIK